MSKRIDLLNGNIVTSLTKLAVPIMATSLIQMAYNLTDMIWIGKMGSNQVAAIGAASMYLWLSAAFAVLSRMGGQVKLAHSVGAGEFGEAVTYSKNAIQLGLFFSILFGAAVCIFANPLIGFFNLNTPEVINDAKVYLYITGGLVVFSIINQILTGLITSSGNSKTPFFATTVGLIANIILDPILIFGIGPIKSMGVAGAAIATVIAQIIVTALFVLYMIKDKLIFSHVNLLTKPSSKHLKAIIKIGFPAAVQSAMMTVISMVIARLIAAWGDGAVAVQKVGSQIESISWMTAEGFASAVNSFIAQNYGAGQERRAIKGYKISLVITCIWGVFSTLALIIFAEPIFKIFINEADIIPLGIDYLVILGFSQLFMCVEILTSAAFSGFGNSTPPAIIITLLTLIRIPMAIALSSTALGLDGVWWSISISSILKGIIMILAFCVFLAICKKRAAQKN